MPSKTHTEKLLHVTRTAAGFEPMPRKTHTEKLLHVTFGIHKKQISLADIARSLVAPTSSRQSFPLPLEPIKKQFFCPAPSVRGWFRHRSCGRSSETIGASPLGAGSETPEQQQDSSPCQAKRVPKNCFTSPLESIKNKSLWPIQPDHSSLRHHLGKWPRMGKRLSLWRKSFGGRFRNTRTAAGFEPMPSKTQPDKMLPVTFGIHKKQFFCPAPSVRGWFRNHWRKSLGGGDPTKCLAHAKQNPSP